MSFYDPLYEEGARSPTREESLAWYERTIAERLTSIRICRACGNPNEVMVTQLRRAQYEPLCFPCRRWWWSVVLPFNWGLGARRIR